MVSIIVFAQTYLWHKIIFLLNNSSTIYFKWLQKKNMFFEIIFFNIKVKEKSRYTTTK